VRLADMLIAELQSESAATRRLLERVPEDKLGWKPHAKSMALGALANHVATIPVSVAELSVPDEREMGGFSTWPAPSKQDILANHDKSLARAQEILGGYDDAKMQATWTMKAGGKQVMALPRAGLLRAVMFNHLYHHRGQLSVYLRLLDVALPSTYGPSADENPFRQ
jgi:uncharacterized damage-inducible protein DinB